MPDFSRIISMAYLRILERAADRAGLDSYNQRMNSGLTEAMMREALLRSPEYAQRNPLAAAARAAASTAGAKRKKGAVRKGAARKTAARKKAR
jgi:hypothetical protein